MSACSGETACLCVLHCAVILDTDPHGLALTPGPINRLVTLDYVDYSTTFKPSSTPRSVCRLQLC